jgi:hypothetical protein
MAATEQATDQVIKDRLIEECVNERVWAVVGASIDTRKYGYRVFRVLTDSGYLVYPVNPNRTAIDGVIVYPTVGSLPRQPGVVNLVAPPAIGLQIVRDCADAGIQRIWFQPGAESPAAIALADQRGLRVVAHACAMVRRRRWGDAPMGDGGPH